MSAYLKIKLKSCLIGVWVVEFEMLWSSLSWVNVVPNTKISKRLTFIEKKTPFELYTVVRDKAHTKMDLLQNQRNNGLFFFQILFSTKTF